MNKLTALLTITILLTSILAPATTLALTTPELAPKLQEIGEPKLSKTEVYLGPDATIEITVSDPRPIDITITGKEEGGKKNITVKLIEEVKELNDTARDTIHAFINITVAKGETKKIDRYNITNITDTKKVLLLENVVAYLNLTETDNKSATFTATLTILPGDKTGVDTINGTRVIYVHPEDVAKGIVVKIIYPDLVEGELKWFNSTFKIEAKPPSIDVDKEEVAPGQNFTIILTAQSLNPYSRSIDYIKIVKDTVKKLANVFWVAAEYSTLVGHLRIKVLNEKGKEVKPTKSPIECIVDPQLGYYKETGANTGVFKIMVNGTCLSKDVGIKEGYKINITYKDLFTGRPGHAVVLVKEPMISLKASMYYEEKPGKYVKVKDELKELPITFYTRWQGPDTEPIIAGFNYTLNITVEDPALLDDNITVKIYNVENKPIEGGEFNVTLEGSGAVRYAVIWINFTETEQGRYVNFTYKYRTSGGEQKGGCTDVGMDKVYSYPATGYIEIKYPASDEKYARSLKLPIALPKDDKITVVEPETLDRVAGNITLRFVLGDLPVVPEDLAVGVKWTSRDGRPYTYYFKAGELGMNLTTGVAEINITKTLASRFDNDCAKAARAIVGTTITFTYEDPVTRFNFGKECTFRDSVKVPAHDAEVKLSSDEVGPFQWLNITITDPDIFYEAEEYIERNLVLLFNSTAEAKTVRNLDSNAFVFEQDGDKYKIAIKLWEIADYFDPNGDTIIVYYYDDTPADKYKRVYSYQGEVVVKPTKGVVEEPKEGAIVQPGQELEIVVKDPDPRKVDPTEVDMINVTVWSSSYMKKKNITLFETDKDSGVFKTKILVTDEWGYRDDPGTVYAKPGDYIYIVYHDSYPDETKTIVLTVKKVAPAKKWIYINESGVELAKDEQWFIREDPATGAKALTVKLPFYNATDRELLIRCYSVLYYRESPEEKPKFIEMGPYGDVPILEGAKDVELEIGSISVIGEKARKYGGEENGLYKIYVTLIMIYKGTRDELATKVWKPEVGWVTWPVTLTVYVDAQGNIEKVVLGRR